MIQDIENATKFPPVIEFKTEVEEILQDISDITVMFGGSPLDIAALKANTVNDGFSDEMETDTDTYLAAESSESGLSEMPEAPELPDVEELLEEAEGQEEADKTTSEDKQESEDTSTDE